MIPPMPYGWLFPRTSAVVHHGGAGTTAEAFHAGQPTVICPFFGDQPFWAERSMALGVGTPPVPRSDLTAERLAEAIHQAVSDPDLRRKAEALKVALSNEDGAQVAAGIIEDMI